MPDHSGDAITLRGCTWVSPKAIRTSAFSSAIPASGTPARCSSVRNPSSASRPFVTPESARIVSHQSTSRARLGRPSRSPFRRRSSSTSASGFQPIPFVAVPSSSTSGPSASHLSSTAP